MSELRKVFICKSCEGIYADEPVTACDCIPAKNNVYELEQAYIIHAELREKVLELCKTVMAGDLVGMEIKAKQIREMMGVSSDTK